MGDISTALVLRNFGGLDQSRDEELIKWSDSPDCVNMDTSYGGLRTAKGYSLVGLPVLEGGILSLGEFYRRSDGKNWLLAANESGIYAYEGGTGALDFYHYDGDVPGAETWTRIYTPAVKMGRQVDFLNYQDGESDVVLMADGVNPVLTWAGTGEATPREGIQQKFAHIEMNFERVWGAGAPGEPDTVYWSRQFDIGNWTGDIEDPDNGGGYLMVPTWDGGEIRLIRTLFDDIVIFKDEAVLRVSGTYPGEYNVQRVNGVAGPIAARTVVQYGGRVYFLGKTGLCIYDGMRASDAGDRRAQLWYDRINPRYAENACSVVHGHIMYIALPVDESEKNNIVFEYDMSRDTIMVRTGIEAEHWLEYEDELLFAGSDGRIYRYGDGDTYDGKPIEAKWETPVYNMGSGGLIGDRSTKQLGEISAYGTGRMHILIRADGKTKQRELIMPSEFKRSRRRLNIRGRRFKLTLRNVDGLPFSLRGNVTVDMEIERD